MRKFIFLFLSIVLMVFYVVGMVKKVPYTNALILAIFFFIMTLLQETKKDKESIQTGTGNKKELWGMFINYKTGGHYIGVYLTLEHTLGVVHELLKETYKNIDSSKNDNLPEVVAAEMEKIKKTVGEAGYWDKNDSYYHVLNDGAWHEVTWFTIQPIGKNLVNVIGEDWKYIN